MRPCERMALPPIKYWNMIRKEIIERDNHRCRICGNGPEDLDCALNVHHKDYNRDNNESSNLVTLCRYCHKQVHTEGYKPILFEDWPIPWGEDPS